MVTLELFTYKYYFLNRSAGQLISSFISSVRDALMLFIRVMSEMELQPGSMETAKEVLITGLPPMSYITQ